MDCIDLNLSVELGNTLTVIHPAVIVSGDRHILCDCGYPGQGDQFLEALAKHHLQNLEAVLLTHHDHDHVGALAFLKRQLPDCVVMASEIDAPYIEGQLEPLRLTQALELKKRVEREGPDAGEGFIAYLQSIELCPVDRRLKYEERDLIPGVRLIPTPGHTAGHLSLYLEESASLIAGDLVVVEDGRLDLAYPQYAQSLTHCLESLERTGQLAIERVLCYHGGWFTGDYQAQVVGLLRKYKG